MSTKYVPTTQLLALHEGERIRWAEALESGDYAQCRGNLHCDDGYCCLGVWESINGVDDDQLRYLGEQSELNFGGTQIGDVLPETVAFTFDRKSHVNKRAAILNDQDKLTFPEIAQLLRGNTVEKS